ncbi:MAG: DUF2079 domain-containing protein, partial [Patescibacteria group bacterium]|nr:DUF2079 domain-containing protein [Patescibacteria group bacterium]
HGTTLSGWAIEAEYILFGAGVVSLFSIGFLLSNLAHLSQARAWTVLVQTIFFLLLISVLSIRFISRNFPQKSKKVLQHTLPYFSFWENTHLLSISIAAFAMLGLGTFASIAAIAPIPLKDIITYSSFFTLAMIAGYAAFITPMGLGVREGIVTAGLLSLFSVSFAGFLAFFARLVLILGEVVFLGIVALWQHLRKQWKQHVELFIGNNKYKLLVLLFVIAYIVYFSAASFLRYTNFYAGRFDLGNMDQTVWNTAHGRWFMFTNPDGTNIISRLSFHADFILILLAPFYLIWQDPRMLLLIQTVITAFGAIFVYLLAQNFVKNKPFATVLAIIYLLSPQIQHANLYDFHAVTLATTFLLGAYYFLIKKQTLPFLIFLALAAITKEQVWVVTALFGLYAITFKKMYKLGSAVFVISLALFWYIFFKAIPLAHGGKHFALYYYSDFGSSPTEIIKTIVFVPTKTLATMFAPDRVEYLKQLLLPLGFLVLLSPLYLVFTLPDLLINLLSNNPPFHQIFYQYSAVIVPFLFIGTMHSVVWLRKRVPKIPITFFSYYIVLFGLLGAFLYGPLPGEQYANTDMFTKPLSYAYEIDDFLGSIPTRYSIAATNNLGSHLSHRQLIYTIPTGIDQADVIVFLLNDRFAQPSLATQKEMATKLEKDPNYVELFKEQDFIAFAKKSLNFQKRLRKEVKYFPFIQQWLRSVQG